MNGWSTWGGAVSQVTDGMLEVYRSTNGTSATVFETLTQPLAQNSHVELSLAFGNSGAIDKRLVAIVRNADWSSYLVCPFLLPAHSPLQSYSLRGRATVPWAESVVELSLLSADDAGWLQVDDLRLHRIEVPEFLWVTACSGVDWPAALNLVRNGDFGAGLEEWSWWGGIDLSVDNGTLELQRQEGAPGASVFQFLKFTTTPGMPLAMTFELGNSALVEQHVPVIVRKPDWSKWVACPFTIPANAVASDYRMEGLSVGSWENLLLEVQLFSESGSGSLTLDNMSVVHDSALVVSGTVCEDPHN